MLEKLLEEGQVKSAKPKDLFGSGDGFQFPTSMKTHFQLRSRFEDSSVTEEAPNGSVFLSSPCEGCYCYLTMGRSGLHRAGNVILLLWMETGTRSDPVPTHHGRAENSAQLPW